jgi:hypothetical protein
MHHGRYGNADALLSFCFWSRRDLRPGILLLLLLLLVVSRLLTLLYLNCNRNCTLHCTRPPSTYTTARTLGSSLSQSIHLSSPVQRLTPRQTAAAAHPQVQFSPYCCPSSAQTQLTVIQFPCVLRLCALHSIHSLSSLALPALSALPCCCSLSPSRAQRDPPCAARVLSFVHPLLPPKRVEPLLPGLPDR